MIGKKNGTSKCGKNKKHAGCHNESDLDYCYSVDYTPLRTLRDQVFGNKNGQIFPHQQRWGSAPLEEVYRKLKEAGFDEKGILHQHQFPHKFKNFEELYDTIESIIRDIRGIGDLAIYDISVRIGNHQTPEVLPKDYVYIHAGTKIGAERALGHRINEKRIPLSTFSNSPYLNGMNALEIEDFLCIYKDMIPQISSNAKSPKATKSHKQP